MPLPPPVEREKLHQRRYEFQGYRRGDGLWDIEGRMVDTKAYAFENRFRGRIEPGTPVHDMQIRLTIDDDFLVHDIVAVTNAGPFEACPAITPDYRRMIGSRIGPGWKRVVREKLGGVQGCTHLSEMLGAMATVAYQTLFSVRHSKREAEAASGHRPAIIGSCHAFASDGEVVRQLWPQFYTGEDRPEDGSAPVPASMDNRGRQDHRSSEGARKDSCSACRPSSNSSSSRP